MSDLRIRPHQEEAVESGIRALSGPVTGEMPARGLRAQIIMAPGSGKTLIGAEIARRLTPEGQVLVLVPTLDLITQTIQAWRSAGHDEPMIAVCSLEQDALLDALNVRATTNPTRLALWCAKGGPVTVFATYASLSSQGLDDDSEGEDDGEQRTAPGVLELALRGTYGQSLRLFDLAIVDEAHRTSGRIGKPWAAIHDQARIPAARRLYMTATRRLWEVPKSGWATRAEEAGEALEGRLVASMDDEGIYGPVVYELPLLESVERGLNARFQIDVLEIRDEGAGAEVSDVEREGRRLAALQAALLRYLDEAGVRSLMTFHQRTLSAMAFARALPRTAAMLHGSDARIYPKRVAADWISGEHPAAVRREVLARFADGLDAEGWVTDASFLASCRVLGEGTDIRGRRGVGGVVFADRRSSAVEIVQIVGRALRQDPGEGKVARLVVPVFLQPGEDPEKMMSSASYRPLVAVLQGLRAYDDRIIEQMMAHAETKRGAPTSVLALDPDAPQPEESDDQEPGVLTEEDESDEESLHTDEDDSGSDEGPVRPSVPLLEFSTPRDPSTLTMFLRTRVLWPDSELWLTGYDLLRDWVEEYGHARVPQNAIVEGPDGEPYNLGVWVAEQRQALREGRLHSWRIQLLDELGLEWNVHDARFAKMLPVMRDCVALHGTLCVPKETMVDDEPAGQWLANRRKPGGLGRNEERAAERRAQLDAIDPYWDPPWALPWQRHYAKVFLCVTAGASLDEILPGLMVDGDDIGTWVRQQQADWGQLMDGQRDLLAELGVGPAEPAAEPEADAASRPPSAWEISLGALTQFRDREGHVKVPRQHKERWTDQQGVEHTVSLGVFRSNQRARRGKLTPERAAELEKVGLFD